MVLLNQVVGHKSNRERLVQGVLQGRQPSCSLYVGPSGIGKKMMALAIAQTLVCEKAELACGSCGACVRIAQKQSESLLLVEPDGVAIKIDQVRQILRFVSLQNVTQARAVIIDGAEKLNATSANALLKTLEEPPPNTYFFLISNSLASILPTIRSRSQVARFSPLTFAEVEQVTGLQGWAVQACEGRPELAVQLSESEDVQKMRLELFDYLKTSLGGLNYGSFGQWKDLVKDKENSLFWAESLQKWVRDLYRIELGENKRLAHPDQKEWSMQLLEKVRSSFTEGVFEFLDRLWQASLKLEKDILGNVDRQLSFENFVLRLVV